MIIEAIEKTLKVKRPDGDVLLIPGTPMEFTEKEGLKLLTKAKGKVRLVEPSRNVIEPAQRLDGKPISPIYWETGTGNILGPAVPEYFARNGETFWIVTTFEGQIRWINADRLRNKKQFEQQRKQQIGEMLRDRK